MLGSDDADWYADVDRTIGSRIHESVRAADEDVPRRIRQPRDQLAHHRAVDAAAVVAIAHRSPARQRDQNVTNFSQWD